MKNLLLIISLIIYGSVNAEDSSIKLTLRNLLKEKHYLQLNHKLNEYQNDYQKSFENEENLITAYKAFEIVDDEYKKLIEEWIKFSPTKYQPYLAQSFYNIGLAWNARGHKWASETTDTKFNQMNIYMSQSKQNTIKAIELFKESIVPYYLQIRINNSLGEDEKSILQKGLDIFPGSYKLREVYLNSISPKWGGSIKQMQIFIENTKVLYNQYPYLKTLQGLPFYEVGKIQYLDKVYSGAIRLYTKALSFGDNHLIYFKRGRAYYKKEDYQNALKDMDKAIGLYPDDLDYYYYRAFVHSQLDDQKKDIADSLMVLKFNPKKSSIIKHIKYIVSKLNYKAKILVKNGNAKDALKIYQKVIELDPKSARNYSLQASAYIKLNNYDKSIESLNTAIDIDAGEFYYHNLLDWVLTRKKEWDKIIETWDQYLKIHPHDDEAMVQQSGAYYRKGEIKKALEIAKKAADLGNIQGKEIYNKYKHLLN